VLSRVGLYHCGLGRWEQAEKYLSDSMQISEQIGDYRQWGEAAALKLNLLHLTARYQESIDLCHQIARRSARTGDVQQQMWGCNYQAQSVLRMNRVEEAYLLLRQAEELIEHHVSLITSSIINHGLLALASLRRGSPQDALSYAALTSNEITGSRSPNVFSLLEGYACPAEVYLELENVESAESACKSMFRYARRFPIGQPRAWLLQGIYHRLKGDFPKAMEAWQKSLEFARHYRMPYEEGLALYHLGTGGAPDSLSQAAAIFESIHATYELQLTRRALEDKVHAS
ncbi:MAG: tetratricopeptide repeat protein, partial [Anaerolineae bacterium]|nr:tetratricopeptide repeat protein [Anaerolineae bacterium]